MASLVFWKKKVSKYSGDDNEDLEIKGPKEPCLNGVGFIKKDKTNAKAMERMNLKW